MVIDDKIILYDGVWDLSSLRKTDMIAYTSLITQSSHMMPIDKFERDYKPTQSKLYNRQVYIHKDYRRM